MVENGTHVSTHFINSVAYCFTYITFNVNASSRSLPRGAFSSLRQRREYLIVGVAFVRGREQLSSELSLIAIDQFPDARRDFRV